MSRVVVVVAAATPILGFYGALHPAPHDASNLNWLGFYVLLASAAVCLLWVAAVGRVGRLRTVDRVEVPEAA